MWHQELLELSTEARTIAITTAAAAASTDSGHARAGRATPSWNVTVFRIEGRRPGLCDRPPPPVSRLRA
jgi:hypothetical protein